MTIILPPRIGQDEHEVLKKLDKPPAPNAPMTMAPFRIEIHLGRRRTLTNATGRMLLFESGKRLDGDGDDLMYWCGYVDCRQPIKSDFFQEFHADCPSCKRTNFRAPDMKTRFISAKGLTPGQKSDLRKLPVLCSEFGFVKMTTQALAAKVSDEFNKLGRCADVMLHFHPRDIRNYGLTDVQVVDHYDAARAASTKNKVVYPLYRIIRDLSVPGVSFEKQIEKMLAS